MNEGVKVKVHLVDSKGRPALITYKEDASLADVAEVLNVPPEVLGVLVVKSSLTAEQSHPQKLHRVIQGNRLSSERVSIEELI